MPGVEATNSVTAGQKDNEVDLILTIEAMKMETGLQPEKGGVLKAVHVKPGDQIDAKDLLVELE
jgi:pyruvate carboxylase